jgi:hypothetical protein
MNSIATLPRINRSRSSKDRVHRELLRRIDACAARRHEAARDSIPQLATWTRERDRGDKLRHALKQWISDREPPALP